MADGKANILISVNAIIISVILTRVVEAAGSGCLSYFTNRVLLGLFIGHYCDCDHGYET